MVWEGGADETTMPLPPVVFLAGAAATAPTARPFPAGPLRAVGCLGGEVIRNNKATSFPPVVGRCRLVFLGTTELLLVSLSPSL